MQQSSKLLICSISALVIITYFLYGCPMSIWQRQGQDGVSVPNAGNSDSYKAFMLECEELKQLVPDEYQVFLHQGYSLDDHKTFVGRAVDFDSATRVFMNETATHGLIYRAHLDKDALAAVRADIGVDLVLCEMWEYPPDDI